MGVRNEHGALKGRKAGDLGGGQQSSPFSYLRVVPAKYIPVERILNSKCLPKTT